MARLFLLLLSLLLFSCQESQETKISRLVKEWEGKEIIIPSECSFSDISGNECSSPSLNAPFKIVYYVDSLGCMSCKLRLEEWKKFIKEADSISEGKISYFFYFHPKQKDLTELGDILKSHAFDIPVCIDTLDVFNASNLFPENDSFHTFLLDESNHVSVIGNPILSPSIKDLYLQVIMGKKMERTQRKLTQASISESLLELGVVKLDELISKRIRITNKGREPLIITDVITSCDCVKAKSTANEVLPNESAEISIEFKPDEKGEFFRDVYVYCNVDDSIIDFTTSWQD